MHKLNCNKKFYSKYNYPDIKELRSKHIHLIKKILSYANLSVNSLKNKDVLDAGCGTGDKAIFFSLKGANVTGIDFALGQLLKAKEKANKQNTKVKLVKTDILNPYLDKLGKFDYIFCLGVLHHTQDPKKGFNNLCKLLKKDGIIVIALYHRYSRIRYRIIRRLIRIFVSKDPEKIMQFLFSKNIFANLINKGSKETIYDRYAVPHESYHTLKEIKKWFNNNGIVEIKHSKNVNGFEPLKIFEKKTLFFVSGVKHK